MIKGSRTGNLAASLKTVSHTMTSGLSLKLGGNDEGPNPHEFIEAGLAACTILTCQLYANRKGWNLVSTTVSVSIVSETKAASGFIREINFEGDLSDAQREQLFDIANKCPIHNLLESKITVETKII